MRNIIGVFGLICSGKSSFSKMLAENLNALYIDADKIGHSALIEKKDDILKLFYNDDILDIDNNIDRKKLGKIVFNNKEKLKLLESVSHSYIFEKIKELINTTDKDIVIEAALIMRTDIYKLCNSLIYVNSRTSSIIKRMKKSRNISEYDARKILKAQRDVKNKKLYSDIIVNNMKDYNNLCIIAKKLGMHYDFKSKRIFKQKRKRIFY